MLVVAVHLRKFMWKHKGDNSCSNIPEPERIWRLVQEAEARTRLVDCVKDSPVAQLRETLCKLAVDVRNFLQENMDPNLLSLYSQSEKCPIDGSSVSLEDYGTAECQNNHQFERCILSHRCLCNYLDEDVLQCPMCLCFVLTSSINCSDTGYSHYCPICWVYLKGL